MNSCNTLVIILLIFSHFLVLCHIHVHSSFIIRRWSFVVQMLLPGFLVSCF